MLAYWFARKNADDTVIIVTIFITGTNQVSSITDNIVLLHSKSLFYKLFKLIGAQYKHRCIFTLDGSHRVVRLETVTEMVTGCLRMIKSAILACR